MITIDLWVNDDFKLHGIVFEDTWLYCNLNTIVKVLHYKFSVLHYKFSYTGIFGSSPTEIIQRHQNGECSTRIYYYATLHFHDIEELLPLIHKQLPELFL